MVIGCVIQARMGSSRLPGKTLLKLDDEHPIIYYVINQLRFSKSIDSMVIATTTLKEDDEIARFSKKINVKCFRGHVKDVLDRYYRCAKKFSFSTIVRVTSDNPLIDPAIVDQVVNTFVNGSYDYVSNHIPRTFPQGTEVEIFSFSALEKAWKNATKVSEREHVTPYFYNNPTLFSLGTVCYKKNISYLRWTVDRHNDLELVKIIVSKIKKRPILLEDILGLLKKENKLIKINENHIIDEGYISSLKEDFV